MRIVIDISNNELAGMTEQGDTAKAQPQVTLPSLSPPESSLTAMQATDAGSAPLEMLVAAQLSGQDLASLSFSLAGASLSAGNAGPAPLEQMQSSLSSSVDPLVQMGLSGSDDSFDAGPAPGANGTPADETEKPEAPGAGGKAQQRD